MRAWKKADRALVRALDLPADPQPPQRPALPGRAQSVQLVGHQAARVGGDELVQLHLHLGERPEAAHAARAEGRERLDLEQPVRAHRAQHPRGLGPRPARQLARRALGVVPLDRVVQHREGDAARGQAGLVVGPRQQVRPGAPPHGHHVVAAGQERVQRHRRAEVHAHQVGGRGRGRRGARSREPQGGEDEQGHKGGDDTAGGRTHGRTSLGDGGSRYLYATMLRPRRAATRRPTRWSLRPGDRP